MTPMMGRGVWFGSEGKSFWLGMVFALCLEILFRLVIYSADYLYHCWDT
jgi:hypothetical protein